ncbi:copper amine oxidase N-terminal domain-containing protein [Paenibacillus sp. NEAU-GSW1]|uniref:copper amine oxidase N-terminal domain-containing protein n=1 Tax=Paenibacillus sp. NEAU-GSW1 TaxID=2682486 RepID=UPI0012E2D29F|nr:copper amine oxidase N-terminal domain-containing protein [Paenibacillus sp. NEAU-GSW1]MUT68526.1 hypothetical protein [Paenibacillus sp. NEAU-GSW1]
MKRLFTVRKGLALLLSLVLVIAAGCQAVGGVDLNSVLKNVLKVSSMEGKQTLEVKLQLNKHAADEMEAEELELLQLFSNFKVQLDEVKVQDETHASYKGKIIFGKNATVIGFGLKLSDEAAVIDIDGAKAPIYLDMTQEGLTDIIGIETEGATEEEQASLTELGHKLIDGAGNYIINNLPNPDKLTVEKVELPINGQQTALFHVATELDGPAIWEWIKSYIDALIADKEGLKQFVATMVTLLAEHEGVWESADAIVNPIEELNLDLQGQSKEDIINETVKDIMETLTLTKHDLEELESEEWRTLEDLFNEDTTVKAELYVDSKLDIRKQVLEATIEPDQSFFFPIDGITIRAVAERWNVNGEVVADEPVVSDDMFYADELSLMPSLEVLRMFDKQSGAYNLLKNKFHMNRQIVELPTDYVVYPAILTPEYITLIPLRDVAELMGAEVTFDKQTKKVKVMDKVTNTTIYVEEGSDTMSVNGKDTTMPFPATAINGAMYVPARSFAAAINAKIHWESYFDDGDLDTFIIEREVA